MSINQCCIDDFTFYRFRYILKVFFITTVHIQIT